MTDPSGSVPAKPNFLIMWGDDIGTSNLSCYSDGLMGYRTPNIDRLAREGMRFTDWYAEQSCTAGRSAFITGNPSYRTGLSKVGMPGSTDRAAAQRTRRSRTCCGRWDTQPGSLAKTTSVTRTSILPTMHGFDEFFGNLYHLNAEEEPELPDYPPEKDFPNFRKKYGPRGVLHCWSDGKGGQRIEDTGPLTKKRMETVDDEFLDGRDRLHQAPARRMASRSSSGSTPATCTSARIRSRRTSARPGGGSRPTTTR